MRARSFLQNCLECLKAANRLEPATILDVALAAEPTDATDIVEKRREVRHGEFSGR
jgi:hypothetical protein